MLNEYGSQLVVYPIQISKVLIRNTQLKEPAQHSEKRQRLLKNLKIMDMVQSKSFFIEKFYGEKLRVL
ncbi:MAG: hypothetical protein ACLUTO_09690 [Anaerostipes sp.]